MLIKILLICGSFVLMSFTTFAQSFNKSLETASFIDYEWNNPDLEILSPHILQIDFNPNGQNFRILEQSVINIDKPVSEKVALVKVLSSDSSNVVELKGVGTSRGKNLASLVVHRARTTSQGVLVTRYLKVRVFKSENSPRSTSNKNVRSSTSLLSSGTWFKIPISENNIYQLDFDYLESLGIDPSNIDPRRLQLWGTNGYQLPERNGDARPDFAQIPILVNGESDGVFNADDRVIFYGNSPDRIVRNGQNFIHSIHPYTNQKYVYLTVGLENGLRITTPNLDPSSRTITNFTDFLWKEEELFKPENKFKSGRYWLGQRFPSNLNGISRSVLNDTIPGLSAGTPMQIEAQFAGRSTINSSFSVSLNGNQLGNLNIIRISDYNSEVGFAAIQRVFNQTSSFNGSDGIIDLSARYNHNENNSEGFVDWIRLTFQRGLIAKNNRLFFYSPNDASPNDFANYVLSGFSAEPVVLDVSNPIQPIRISVSETGQNYTARYYSSGDYQLIAQSVFKTPAQGFQIPNQDLKGITFFPNYIIVTAEEFLDEAQNLAAYRQSKGLTPVVVTQNQILNEFSSGSYDPSAVRDYVKFLWDRAISSNEQMPEYLFLFGNSTFDTKNISGSGALENHVLTYQSEESVRRLDGSSFGTFGTDDFFAFMDDGEGVMGNGNTASTFLFDIGVGRLSIQNASEAANYIDKVKRYEGEASIGEWQNLFTFAGDDDFPEISNEDLHVLNADVAAESMNINEPGARINKIYLFSYPVETTAAGRQLPQATNALLSAMNNGSLVINYSGHGNEQTLSDEELFLSEYIPNLTNRDKPFVLVTATCQFGRYDDIDDLSGAEKLVLAPNGGAISAFTTTRVVYTSSSIGSNNNFALNVVLSQKLVERNSDGSPLRFGDIYRNTKNAPNPSSGTPIGSSLNNKKFILLGDPAAEFRLPSKKAELTNLNDVYLDTLSTDLTIRALDRVTLSGKVLNALNEIDTEYNGEATVIVFDADRYVNLPDRPWINNRATDCAIDDCRYRTENDILFKGRAAISNGVFSTNFVIPKDISSSDLNGRVVLFTNSEGITGGGSFTQFKVNGINPNAENDGTGPDLNIYLNDPRFVNGNLVSGSPTLIVELNDETGINTTGTGVGHEITATIDTKPQQTFILNEFYEGNLNDFTGGRIEYPLDNIPDGNYTLKVRAWDVQNNPSENEIFFEVASSEDLVIRNAYNYPNPMNNRTSFMFEHNQPGMPLDVSIRIYTLSGKPVQHIQEQLITTSSYASIPWDGRDRDYDRLGNGTYIYVLRVTSDTPQGRNTTEKIEKLVIIR